MFPLARRKFPKDDEDKEPYYHHQLPLAKGKFPCVEAQKQQRATYSTSEEEDDFSYSAVWGAPAHPGQFLDIWQIRCVMVLLPNFEYATIY